MAFVVDDVLLVTVVDAGVGSGVVAMEAGVVFTGRVVVVDDVDAGVTDEFEMQVVVSEARKNPAEQSQTR